MYEKKIQLFCYVQAIPLTDQGIGTWFGKGFDKASDLNYIENISVKCF